MSATFVCPHCNASYPRKPVLVGRAVRCTTCKNAFRLREDGIADAIEMPGSTAQQTPEPPPPAAASSPLAPSAKPPAAAVPSRPIIPLTLPPGLAGPPKAKSAAPAASSFASDKRDVEVVEIDERPAPPAPPPAALKAKPSAAKAGGAGTATVSRSGEPGKTRGSEILTAQQQDVRRAMAATLANSMTAALQAETLKNEQQSAKPTKTPSEGRVGKIGPAILTGEGVRMARLRLAWWLIAIGLIASIGGCSWLIMHRNPRQQALDFYSSAVTGARNRTDRIGGIQERAWLIGLPPANIVVPAMSDLSDAHIGPVRTYRFSVAKALFDQVNGMVISPRVPLWMPKAAQAELEARLVEGLSVQKQVAAILQLNKGAIDYRDWKSRLEAAGFGTEGADAIDLLLRGRTKASGENIYAARFLAGKLPDAIEIVSFAGRKGSLVISRSQSYEQRTVQYQGVLLHFVGKDWPQEWRVLTISTAMNAQQ